MYAHRKSARIFMFSLLSYFALDFFKPSLAKSIQYYSQAKSIVDKKKKAAAARDIERQKKKINMVVNFFSNLMNSNEIYILKKTKTVLANFYYKYGFMNQVFYLLKKKLFFLLILKALFLIQASLVQLVLSLSSNGIFLASTFVLIRDLSISLD